MIMYWYNNNKIFKILLNKKINLFYFFGLGSTVFLFFHVYFLGTTSNNEFLKDFPQYREIIRKSTTSSLSRSSMGSVKVFDRVIPKSDKKYDIIYRNPYKAKDRKLSNY